MLISELSVCEIRVSTSPTKKDIKELEVKVGQLETKIEKGFKEVIVWGSRCHGCNWWTWDRYNKAVLIC